MFDFSFTCSLNGFQYTVHYTYNFDTLYKFNRLYLAIYFFILPRTKRNKTGQQNRKSLKAFYFVSLC